MSDPVTGRVAEQTANQAVQHSTASPTEIDINDESRFADALNQSDSGSDNVAQAADAVNGDVRPVEEVSLGDAILNGLEKMKSSHDARSERIEKQLTESVGADLSVQDCVRLQFEVMQMSMEQELTGKIADKTSQGVQTLFKNQ